MNPNSSIKLLPVCALLLLLGAACGTGNKSNEPTANRDTSSTAFQPSWIPVERGPVTTNLKLFGKIVSANHARAQVYPMVEGSVSRTNVSLGDEVKRGQLLAIIKTARFAELENERMEALNRISVAEKELEVAKQLMDGKLNTERDVLIAESELSTARSALKKVDQTYATLLQKAGGDFEVRAPMAGFIVEKNINENMQVSVDKIGNLFSIARIDTVWVLANVNESDIDKITMGMEADVQTLSYPGKVFRGKVDRIYNFLDAETHSMQIRMSIPNPGLLLKPEMSTTVLVKYIEPRSLPSVPSSALIFDESKYWVLVRDEKGAPHIRQVEIYRQTNQRTYLESGLKEGEEVVGENQLLLYNQLKN